MVNISILIPAGGSGTRFGGVKKQFQILRDETLLNHCIKKFLERDDVAQIVVSLPEEDLHHISLIQEKRVRYVTGGSTRSESVCNAFKALRGCEDKSIILIHDAARPFVSKDVITRVIEATIEFGAAVPSIPVVDTIKQVDGNGIVVKTLPREHLRSVQTPQGFWFGWLKQAYEKSYSTSVTDEAMLVEAAGFPVHVVEGDVENVKVTTERDLQLMQ